jgi:hypothetical protein
VRRNAKASPTDTAIDGNHPDSLSAASIVLSRAETVALIQIAVLDAATGRTARDVGNERQNVLAGVSPSVREAYQAATRAGARQGVVALREGGCSGCGEPLPEAARRSITESVRVVTCPACERLVYDHSWVDREFMPLSLKPVQRIDPWVE